MHANLCNFLYYCIVEKYGNNSNHFHIDFGIQAYLNQKLSSLKPKNTILNGITYIKYILRSNIKNINTSVTLYF